MQATVRVGPSVALGSVCNEIEFFTNEKEDALLVSLMQPRPAPAASAKLAAFATALAREVPELRGVGTDDCWNLASSRPGWLRTGRIIC